MCSAAAFPVNVFQTVGNSLSIVPLIGGDTRRAHAVGFGEAGNLCSPGQQRMQKHLPAVAEVQVVGI